MNKLLKQKIKFKKPVLGTWNTIASGLATEVIAKSGLDFVILDFEHGPFDFSNLSDWINRCLVGGASPIVRVPVPETWMIQQALDQGAHGILVPHMDTPDAVEKFISDTYFAPKGGRGFSPFTKAGGFSAKDSARYVRNSNENLVRAIIIESGKGFDNLDAILEVPHLDVVYFGAYDLSAHFGHPGDIYHPDVLQPLKKGIQKVIRAGKCPGGFVAHSEQDIKRILNFGIRFLTYGVDANILLRDYQAAAASFHKKHAK